MPEQDATLLHSFFQSSVLHALRVSVVRMDVTMHEMSIAVELMRQLETLAAENDVERIEEVAITVGAMRQIVPEMLGAAFEAIAVGTVAEGAVLKVQVAPALAKCRPCGREFEPTEDSFLCPQCGQADVRIVKGDDIVLSSVTCEQKEGASSSED